MQSKNSRTTSPKNLELVTQDSMDSEFDLPTPDSVPMKKNRDTAEYSEVAEETKRLMAEVELDYAENRKSLQ